MEFLFILLVFVTVATGIVAVGALVFSLLDGITDHLLSKYGTVYRCVEQAECKDLEKGDHVTFEWLPGGSSVQGTPDARKVVKG